MDTVKKAYDIQLKASDHALVFAWISRAVALQAGQQTAEKLMRKAVRVYGRQRGKRMALRAIAANRELTMTEYIAWKEWRVPDSDMQQTVMPVESGLEMRVQRCPWHTTWQTHDLMAYGRFYCMEIDLALVEGFNPALRLEVGQTRPQGYSECLFRLHDAQVPEKFPGSIAILPWDYHIGHLYVACRQVITAAPGIDGHRIMNTVRKEMEANLGTPALETILSYEHVDFDQLPEQA